jgi:hypothetical protein
LALSFSVACGAMRVSFPVIVASGRAPMRSLAGSPTLSFPTSISSTVPLKMRSFISAIDARSVPAW